MRAVLGFVAVGLAVLVAGSYAGVLHPAGDSLAVLRYPMLLVLLGVAIALRTSWLARGAMLLCAVLLADRVRMAQDGIFEGAIDVVIYQKNMLYRAYDEGALIADIRASGARVVTLQEVSRAHAGFLRQMQDSHPYQVVCEGTRVGAVVVLSADPVVTQACSAPTGIAMAEIAATDGRGPLRAVSVHLHWPWPYGQAAGLDAVLPQLAGLAPMPTVVGGDFNMVPWGHAMRRVGVVFDVRRIGHVRRTFALFGWPLAIDHVMAGPDAAGQIDVRPRLGSDHFGVLGRVVFEGPTDALR